MGILDSFKKLFNKEEESEPVKPSVTTTTNNIVYEIDEEDRIVVALAATVMAGQDKPDSEFHISKITRIK
jgi:hypothetical protein